MFYREIIAVCSQIHTKHINTVCGRNVELLNIKPGGTYSDHGFSFLTTQCHDNSLRRSKQGSSPLTRQLGYTDIITT